MSKTLVDFSPAVEAINEISVVRKYSLLLCFCLAQFFDSYNNSSLFSAIPTVVRALNMTQAHSTWLISAYQLTFAAFLLISGRLSDVYSPKVVLVTGIFGLAALSIGAGFIRESIALLVLRAFLGIAAASTIPSSLSLLVAVFPRPKEQARAIGIFGGLGGVANILGLPIGAVLVEFASWPWCFYVVAIMTVPLALVCLLIIPSGLTTRKEGDGSMKAKGLDPVGITTLTIALILFIFATTSGSTYGWGSGAVLAPLLISIALMGVFLYWETLIPVDSAAIPPRTWFYPNFSMLFAISLLPYFFWSTCFIFFMTYWQNNFGWSVISSVIHLLPMSISGFLMSFTGSLSRVIHSKWLILTGLFLLIISSALLSLGSTPDRYWRYIFPGLIFGSTGGMLTYAHANIAIFRTSPPSMAGTVGAIFNAGLQMGSAIGLAAVTSVETSVNSKSPDATGADAYKGYAAGLYLMLGVICVEFLAVAIFYRNKREIADVDEVSEQDGRLNTMSEEKIQNRDVDLELEGRMIAEIPVT